MNRSLLIVICTLICMLNLILLSWIIKSNIENANYKILLNKYEDYIFDLQLGNIDTSEETLSHELFKDTTSENIMIYRLFRERCDKCVITELSMLKEIEKNYGIKFLVLHPEPKSRQEDVLNKNMLGNLSYKYVTQDEFNIEMMKFKKRRFCAILNKDGVVSNVFFPDFELPALLDAYSIKAKAIME